MSIDPDAFDAITFDCYGTLIDWEAGILATLGAWFDSVGFGSFDREGWLEMYGRMESSLQAASPGASYRDILCQVAEAFATELGLDAPEPRDFIGASIADWPAFDDSHDALRRLQTKYKLVIVSNIDDDLIEGSIARLGVTFDEVVTAQQVGSYKPAPGHFDEARRRLGLPKERILHAAQSLFHDIAPANQLGFTTVWVNRQAGRPGATPRASAQPNAEVASMAALAELLNV